MSELKEKNENDKDEELDEELELEVEDNISITSFVFEWANAFMVALIFVVLLLTFVLLAMAAAFAEEETPARLDSVTASYFMKEGDETWSYETPRITFYSYDEDGLLCYSKTEAELAKEEDYTLDESGRWVTSTEIGQWCGNDDRYTYTTIRKYDEHNNVVKETTTYNSLTTGFIKMAKSA